MKFKLATGMLVALAVVLTISMSKGVASVAAAPERSGQLHVLKDCEGHNPYCTLVSSNVPVLQNATVFYDQAPGFPNPPTGPMLDSNVVLYVGENDWAVGRCTLGPNSIGLCTFSDGIGKLNGFQARLRVAPAGGNDYTWDGPYSFNRDLGGDENQ